MQKLRLLFLLFICAQAANAQIKLTPKPAPQPAPVRTAPAKPTQPAAPAVPRAAVEVCWKGEGTVNITLDDKTATFAPGNCQNMNLRTGKGLKVSVQKPAATYYAEEFLLVDPSGGSLELSLQAKGNNAYYVVLNYESTKTRQERLAAEERARQEALQRVSTNMVYVAGGTFTMGCTAEQGSDCFEAEKPAHQVTLSSFRMGKYEVTQAEWEAVMGSNPSNFPNCPNCPVETVSWDDIQLFLQKLNTMTGGNYRLPTEAEWEYAARGGNRQIGTQYSGSDNIDAVAWYDGNSGSKTHPVGQKQANALGLYDMTGNVWEWCSDWSEKEYYSSSPLSNPRGPSSGTYRVLRGGGWGFDARCCRVSFRAGDTPDSRYGLYGGFRLVSPSL